MDYDLLSWEGDILRLKFWAQAFDVLKASGAVYLQTEGRLAGCWVMPIQDEAPGPRARGSEARLGNSEALADLVTTRRRKQTSAKSHRAIQRRRDICRQGHRLSVLEARSARPRLSLPRVCKSAARPALATSSTDGEEPSGIRRRCLRLQRHRCQAVALQKLLKQALVAAGHPEAAERSHHFAHESAPLTRPHASSATLLPDSEDAKRPFVEVSGRRGLGVKADDLLDTLMRNAGREVEKRNPELSDGEREHRADDWRRRLQASSSFHATRSSRSILKRR